MIDLLEKYRLKDVVIRGKKGEQYRLQEQNSSISSSTRREESVEWRDATILGPVEQLYKIQE